MPQWKGKRKYLRQMDDPQDREDLVEEYIKEKLDLVHPISNYIHKIIHTKLYELIRDFPDYLRRKNNDAPKDSDRPL